MEHDNLSSTLNLKNEASKQEGDEHTSELDVATTMVVTTTALPSSAHLKVPVTLHINDPDSGELSTILQDSNGEFVEVILMSENLLGSTDDFNTSVGLVAAGEHQRTDGLSKFTNNEQSVHGNGNVNQKREIDRKLKQIKRLDDNFRKKENLAAKERMRNLRQNSSYRKNERERDMIRRRRVRRLARQQGQTGTSEKNEDS